MKIVFKGQADLKDELEEYDDEDIFNLDEAALFFCLLPDRTVILNLTTRNQEVQGIIFRVDDMLAGFDSSVF